VPRHTGHSFFARATSSSCELESKLIGPEDDDAFVLTREDDEDDETSRRLGTIAGFAMLPKGFAMENGMDRYERT